MLALSYTSFSNYKACPLFFKFKYVDKKKPTIKQNNRWFVEGSVTHECLEAGFKQSRPLNLEYVLSIYDAMFEKVFQDKLKQGVILYLPGENKEILKEKSRLVLLKAVDVIKKLGMDVGEFESEYSIGDYINPFQLKDNLYIQGSIDWKKDIGDSFIISDFKTSKDTTFIKPLQLVLYSLALNKKLNKPVSKAFYLMFRSGAQFNITINKDLQDTVLQMFSEVNDSIINGNFKANPSSKGCSECVFRNTCEVSYVKTGPREITF